MASIQARRRTDGSVSFRVQYRIDKQMRSKSFADPRGARQFADLVDRVGAPAAVGVWESRQERAAGVPTFREWIATYLDESSGILTGIEPGTRAGYRAIADRSLNPVLGDIPVDAITKQDIGRWIAWQEAQPSARSRKANGLVSAKTVRNYHSLLSAVLTAAVEAKHRPDNPARGARLSRGQKHEAVFLTPSEFAVLLHFIPPYYKPLVAFLVGSGTRWSEATALEGLITANDGVIEVAEGAFVGGLVMGPNGLMKPKPGPRYHVGDGTPRHRLVGVNGNYSLAL